MPDSPSRRVPKPEDSYAWKPTRPDEKGDFSSLPTQAFTYQPPSSHHPLESTVSQPSSSPSLSQKPTQNGTDGHVSSSLLQLKDEPSRLPPSQSPYITLLQKNRGLYVCDISEVLRFVILPECSPLTKADSMCI